MPAAASPKFRSFEHPGGAGTCGSSLNSRRLAAPGSLDQAGMRAGRALAGVATISLLHERGMGP